MKTRDLANLLARAAEALAATHGTALHALKEELLEAARDEDKATRLDVEGLHTYRFKDNPEEKRFAQHWRIINRTGDMLEFLLGPGNQKVRPSRRDSIVAATVIQWLGSPVGQAFLQGLGYKRREEKS